MKMKITDIELNINSILDVKKGRIAPSFIKCKSRHSDCFVYVLSGEAEYNFDNKSYTAQAGNVIYLAHNSVYSINVTDDNYTFIYFDFVFNKDDDTVFLNEIHKAKSIKLLKNEFEKLYHLWKTGSFSDKIYCRSLVYNIYSEIARTFFAQYVSHDRRAQLEYIVNYITENLHDKELSVEKLSKMCNITTVHFRRIFSNIYHVSPIKFILLSRINKAKELLLLENFRISEVAERCGFQNHYYFSKVFKSETNMTPSQFRNFYKTNI